MLKGAPFARCLLFALLLVPCAARAHGDEEPAPPTLQRSYAAPSLKTFVQPTYPAEPMRLGQGGIVILALQITLEGNVASATVKHGVGPLFDEATLEAGRKLKFHPGKLDGHPVSTSIDFEYRFSAPGHTHTEAAPLGPTHLIALPTLAPDPAAATLLQIEGVQETTVEVQAERPLTAASARTVRDRDLRLRPILRPGDLFRVTPGLMLVQHAGGGKANQFLLRGFDADHGTDIALSFDGIPINMVSHGHGQGYADANFVIPELVERVEVSKGPYFTENGDFSTAGSVNLVTRNHAESFASFGGGSFDTLRSVAIAAPRVNERLAPIFAAEIVRTNGPFQNPERFTKLNLYTKLTYDIDSQSTVSFGASQYNGSWSASGQLPTRAVKAGLVDFYGSLDPSEGGTTDRQNVFVSYRLRPNTQSEFRALAYLTLYDFRLYSNFTFFSRDPISGDGIEQRDNRTVHGARASYRWLRSWHGLVFDSSLGGDARSDNIANGLSYNRDRERLSNVIDAQIQESSVGVWAKEEVQFAHWLRVVAGVRADHFTFQSTIGWKICPPLAPALRASGARGRLAPRQALSCRRIEPLICS